MTRILDACASAAVEAVVGFEVEARINLSERALHVVAALEFSGFRVDDSAARTDGILCERR